MTRRPLLFLLFILPISGMGQSSSFSFRTIGINQGLSQSSVMDIAFDSIGFAWFATQDGLNRYDGKNFLIFRKTFDDITTPVSSRLGRVIPGTPGAWWLLTSGGSLEKMNLADHHFTAVRTAGNSQTPLPPMNCFYEDRRHNWWMGTGNDGIFCYDTSSGQTLHYTSQPSSPLPLPSNYIQQIMEDHKNQYWVLTDNGLMTFNPSTHHSQTFLHQEGHAGAGGIICSALSEDAAGNYWLGTYGKGAFVKWKTDSLFRPFLPLPHSLIIQTLLADRSGNIWIGTYGNGLFLVEAGTQKIQHFLADNKDPFSLPYNDILCIKEDPNGGIWIGTDGGGVAQYNARFNNFSLLSKENVPEHMPIEQIRAVCTDREKGFYIGTSNNGLGYVNKDLTRFTSFQLPPFRKGAGNSQRIVSLFIDREDGLWVGTQGNGLVILDKNKKVRQHFNPDGGPRSTLPDHTVWCMLPDNDRGSLVWAGTRNGGLCLLDKDRGLLQLYDTTSPVGKKLPENNVRALVRLNDSLICIGFEKRGIRFLNTHTGSLLPDEPFREMLRETFLLKCVFFQYPYLWIGTLGRGLCVYDLRSRQALSITEKDGLPNNTVYGILPDHQGNLWMSTNNGLCRYTPPADPSRSTGKDFNLFTREDGLQSNEFNTGAYHRSADGRLFFGGISGLTLFYPDRLILHGRQPGLAITGIMVNNTPIRGDTAPPYKTIADLFHSENSLSFNFAALDFISSSKIAYFYRLQPYDSRWIDAGNRNYAAYTNLSPGTYVFQVKALSPFSREEARTTTLLIRIQPPFWKTWWFVTLCILSAIALLYAFYRYRISQLVNLQQIRNRIATDLHDDIGSTLTNISLLSELSRQRTEKGEDSKVFLDRISEEVQNSGQALDDIVWSINTNNDSLEQTIARMRRYAAEIFDGANIRYEFRSDIRSAQRKLKMEQRRDCFLVFKETINNIYKHAGAANVHITLTMEAGRLYMSIKDDGKGFDSSAVTHRNGLKNIRYRVEKWEGAARIEAVPGSGTTVSITFPIR